ncbi:hypothetical protein Pfo_009591 [Paulownia fortunei]|nr:hypothetical protein Pfo_009591 [Paulownia fortunei]
MIPLLAICVPLILLLPLSLLYKLWWIPLHVQHIMESQGIKGPSYKFLHGTTKEIIKMKKQTSNTAMDLSHDIFPRIQPHLYFWMKLYGNNFLNWVGTQPQIVVTEPELIKEILSNREGTYPKPKMKGYMKKLLGDGIVVAEGEKWLRLRKLANHAFHGECLKDMVPAMIASVETMLEKWRYQEAKEIEVCSEFRLLTSEVISRTAFGSSYLEGRKIFDMLTKLCALISRNAHKIRFFGIEKFVRTQDDIEADKIEQLLHDSIMEIVKKRQDEVTTGQANSFGSDFLGSLLKVHHDMDQKNQISAVDIIDECKTFYFAGQESTYSLLSWSVLLLAIHTDWQEKARKEVLELFGQENPNSEGIARLKTVSMIIYETLRLYSPVTAMTRRIHSKVRLGKYEFPANVNLAIPPLALHRNPDIWGPDAHLFKPERFAEGLAKATNGNAMAFLGFGFGPRICVGLNFASYEAKITLSMILQRCKFTLSPNYVHSPFVVLTTQPQHGEMSSFLVLSSAISYFLLLFVQFLHKVWWIPTRTRYSMESQGIRGPSYRFIRGNTDEISRMKENSMRGNMDLSHDIFSRTLPHFYSWINIYGKVFYFWNGDRAELVVTEPELVKEVLTNSVSYSRTETDKYIRKIIGDGIVACEGEKWVKLRKLANQAFHAENLKNMIPAMVESVEMMLEKWKSHKTTEVDVCEEFRLLTSEVISRTAFGSSYSEGEKVFQMLRQLVIIISRNAYKIRIPGMSQLFKNGDDIESEKMEKEIQHFFLQILDQRERLAIREAQSFGSDFLGSLLRASHDAVERNRISIQEIIDECKTFYSAGHGTTTILLSWTALLLAIHSDWQQKARDEVLKVFGQQHPNSEGLSRLGTINMIINESLRLYPPLAVNERKSTKGARLGKLILPANIKINLPIIALHHDPTIWGDDAHLFKPERFLKGVAAATKNNLAAFSPFGMGPRTCVGMNFATNEAKIALSMILKRYKFTLSPNYVHSPIQVMTLRPQHGVQVVLHAL